MKPLLAPLRSTFEELPAGLAQESLHIGTALQGADLQGADTIARNNMADN
jgi:hypothetical protein